MGSGRRAGRWLWVLVFLWGMIGIGGTPPAAWGQKTLVVASGADGNSLDPPEAFSLEAHKNADWAFDGLLRFDGNSQKIMPALAESWKVSDDGLVWTFKLRKGVNFHDGTPLNADAVVFSFERQRDLKHPYYSKYFGRFTSKFAAIKVTQKVDDSTVQMVLNEPSPSILASLPFYVGHIVSPTAVKKDPEGFRKNPVGTGYFKFVKWVKDDHIEYVANKDYWDGPPKVDRLIVKVIPDNEVRLLALKKGEIHIAYGIDPSHYTEIEKSSDLKLYTATSLGYGSVAMNCEEPPFDNVKVRKAMQYAVNTERIFKTVFYAYGERAVQPIPSMWPGHNPDLPRYEYSPEKAKSLLAEAGFPKGFKTNFLCFTNPRNFQPDPRSLATLVKSDLAKVGVEADINLVHWQTFLDTVGKGGYGFCPGGWTAGTLDPDGILPNRFHSRYIRKIDCTNLGRYRSARADELIDKGRAVTDPKKREKMYQEVAAEIYKDSPEIFIVHPILAIVARKEVKNVFVHAGQWVPLNRASFD